MVWKAENTKNVYKVAGFAAKAAGGITEVLSSIDSARSATLINSENAMMRMGDVEQVHKAMTDNIRVLTRGSKRAKGKLKAVVAGSNLVLQGSPLMALEEAQQQEWRDTKAVHEQAKFRVKAIGTKIDLGYLQSIAGLKQAQYRAEAGMLESISSLAGLWAK